MKKANGRITILLCVVFTMAGCKKQADYPLCKSNKDCKAGELCHNGRCVQCAADADCNPGEECVNGVCCAAQADAADKEKIAAGSIKTPYDECNLETVYFDYDKSDIRPDAVASLKKTAECLMKKGAKAIVIEGHCDPRGTEEYNMGLGLNRAKSIMNFLVHYGISKEEITIYSMGEEYAQGKDEETWALDRKGQFK